MRSRSSPVIAAAVGVHSRRSAKFAPHDDRNIVEKAAVVQILNERRQAQIEERNPHPRFGEDVFVPIPVVIALEDAAKGPPRACQGHAARSRFDHAPGQEKLVQMRLAAAFLGPRAIEPVTSPRADVLAAQVQGVGEPRRGQ